MPKTTKKQPFYRDLINYYCVSTLLIVSCFFMFSFFENAVYYSFLFSCWLSYVIIIVFKNIFKPEPSWFFGLGSGLK